MAIKMSVVNTQQETKLVTLAKRGQVPVKQIKVSGNSKFTSDQLASLCADMTGAERTLYDLQACPARITAHYNQRGYLLAYAYIPAQDVVDGLLQIVVQEGLLDKIKLTNKTQVSDKLIYSYLNKLSGDVLQQTSIDRQLLLLRGTAGIADVRASLQSGAKPGTSDLLVEPAPSAAYTARLQADNFGNYYTGKYRLGGALAFNNPLKLGDQLALRFVSSDSDLYYGGMAYQLPVGDSGLRVGMAYSRSQYQLGQDFKSLDAYGNSDIASIYASYPFILNQTSLLNGTLGFENRVLEDYTDASNSRSEKKVRLMRIGLSGERQDKLNQAGLTTFDVSLYAGKLSLDDASRSTDDMTARSEGDFTKMTYNLNRLQRITDSDTLSINFFGQLAGENLNSSDKFSLGGPYGVRAYPQGESSGDEGNILNLELAHMFVPQLQGMLFYDYGYIKVNHHQYGTMQNTRAIGGAGIGINARLFGFVASTYLAWQTQGGKPLSEPSSQERSPRFWFQVSHEF
jgi:hemolysin activation/secretion protein